MNKNILEIDPDNQQQDFQLIINNTPETQDDKLFNQTVQALQQIVVHESFQQSQTGFMRKHCQIFENAEQNKKQYMIIFKEYQELMNQCLEEMLRKMVEGFDMGKFVELLPSRVEQIDEEIYEILCSVSEFQVFKQLMLDYKAAYQEQERLKLLTVKSKKLPQAKKVQSSNQNIFVNEKSNIAQSLPTIINKNNPINNNNPTKNNPNPTKKTNQSKYHNKKQKTQQQILVPDLVLTIRPLRKA